MSDEMDRASDALADARLEYAIAESNLAAARAELTRAERNFHKFWAPIASGRIRSPQEGAVPHE